MEKQKLIRIFDKQATRYANRREDPKQQQWRKQLLSRANGKVLELAVGAGANFACYPPGIKLTATDFSVAMLEKAQKKAAHLRLDAEFECVDIEKMDFPNHSFDTVVSTLSLCSYEHPLLVLEKIRRWCKPEGMILFMEHGRSSNPVIFAIQKMLNPLLYRMNGCHHTRNIPELIHKAGIHIVKKESHWLNMVHLIWATPNRRQG